MDLDFTQVMSERQDHELIAIITVERSDYRPEAVLAAEKEVEKRGLDVSEYKTFIEKGENERVRNELLESSMVNSFTRFIHYLVDTILCLLLTVLLLYPMNQQQIIDDSYWAYGFLLIYVSYYVFFEVRFHRTPGKWLTKTEVVMEDGSDLLFGPVLYRTICRFIPLDNISFLFSNCGFHDRLSHTRVVRKEMRNVK